MLIRAGAHKHRWNRCAPVVAAVAVGSVQRYSGSQQRHVLCEVREEGKALVPQQSICSSGGKPLIKKHFLVGADSHAGSNNFTVCGPKTKNLSEFQLC